MLQVTRYALYITTHTFHSQGIVRIIQRYLVFKNAENAHTYSFCLENQLSVCIRCRYKS